MKVNPYIWCFVSLAVPLAAAMYMQSAGGEVNGTLLWPLSLIGLALAGFFFWRAKRPALQAGPTQVRQGAYIVPIVVVLILIVIFVFVASMIMNDSQGWVF